MNINKVSSSSQVYVNENMNTITKEEEHEKEVADQSVVYEGAKEPIKKATYTINKMSAQDRQALVTQLKADFETRQNQFVSMIQKMMSEQTTTYGKAYNIYQFLASGDYTVDPATRLQAQEDISENGYYGVDQTSSRIFDFACALSGDDVEKMKEMEAAFEKGFKQAEEIWGGKLPDISYQTKEAVKKKFEEFYAAMESKTD